MNYIFQVGIDFGQTRCIVTLIDRVLEENLIPRIDMAEPFKGYKKLHYLSQRIWHPINTLHRTLLKYGY